MSSSAEYGEPPIEEILASIRRSIADRPVPRARRVETPPSLAHQSSQDDEFELPAMFRAPRQSVSGQLGTARGASANQQRKSSQSEVRATKAAGHVSRPVEASHGFDQDRAELQPSTLTTAGRIGVGEGARGPLVDALKRANRSLSILGSGVTEEEAPAGSERASSAPDRPEMPMRAPSNEEDGDQAQPVARSNPTAGEPSTRTNSEASRPGIKQDRAGSPTSTDASAEETGYEPDASEPGGEASQTAGRPQSASGSGANEARVPSQSEDGTVAPDDTSSTLKSRATESNTEPFPQQMISMRDTLVVRMGQTRSPERPDTRAHWIGNVGSAEPPSAGSRTQVGGNVASGATGSLDATAIALLLPLFRLWIESNMLPLFEKAIRAEMDNANKESGK